MRAGLLRHRLQIQVAAGAQDSFGAPSKEWTTVATVWGEVLPLLGTERMSAEQIQAQVTHRINIRRRPLTTKERLVFVDAGASRVFNIIEVLRPAERKISLQLLVQEQLS